MSPALIQLITILAQLAIQYAPQMITEIKTVINLVETGRDPTAAEIAQVEALGAAVSAKFDADAAAKLLQG